MLKKCWTFVQKKPRTEARNIYIKIKNDCTVISFYFLLNIYIMIFCLVVAQLVISVPVVVIRFSVKRQSCTVAHLIKQQDSDIS